MKRFCLLFIVIAIFSIFIVSQAATVENSQEYLFKILDLLVEETLDAYNSNDSVKFYKYFSKSMEPVISEQYFKAVYIDIYKKNLGRVKSRKLLLEQSSTDSSFPMLVYEAEFQKYDRVSVIVNFMEKNANYRITGVRFNKIYDK